MNSNNNNNNSLVRTFRRLHHPHRHRPHLLLQPKPDQLNLQHLATLHHRQTQIHQFVFLPNHHHHQVHQTYTSTSPITHTSTLTPRHTIVLTVILLNADQNALDRHFHDTSLQQIIQKVAEHLRHTAVDHQPDDLTHHVDTVHQILL